MDALTALRYLEATRGRWGAAQGQYFKATTPTPGTGILLNPRTSFSDNAATLLVMNSAPANSNVYLIPDYIRLSVSVVDAISAGSEFDFVATLDPTLRYSSGGTQIVTPKTYASNNGPVNSLRAGPAPNIGPYGPQASVYMGSVTLAAASGNLIHSSRGVMKTGTTTAIAVVGDEYNFSFSTGVDGAGSAKAGSAATAYRLNLGPHVIAPQSSLALIFWCVNLTTAPTCELDMGWWEVPAYPA